MEGHKAALRVASIYQQVEVLALLIHALTIEARDPSASSEKRGKINNLIHRLAGQIVGLARAKCADESSLETMALILQQLPTKMVGEAITRVGL